MKDEFDEIKDINICIAKFIFKHIAQITKLFENTTLKVDIFQWVSSFEQ